MKSEKYITYSLYDHFKKKIPDNIPENNVWKTSNIYKDTEKLSWIYKLVSWMKMRYELSFQ